MELTKHGHSIIIKGSSMILPPGVSGQHAGTADWICIDDREWERLEHSREFWLLIQMIPNLDSKEDIESFIELIDEAFEPYRKAHKQMKEELEKQNFRNKTFIAKIYYLACL
jgi:hypothetical protein